MLGISFSPQNYHHHWQFLSKLNNGNDMTSVFLAVVVFRPCVWPLSACCHLLAALQHTSPIGNSTTNVHYCGLGTSLGR